MSAIVAVFLLLIAAWTVCNVWEARRSRAVRQSEASWLPEDLQSATLVYSEHVFVATRPFLIGAIIDRAYRRPDGVLVLVEFKQRDKLSVYRSDIVELSAQKLAIENATGERIAEHGYVALVSATGTARCVLKVILLTVDEISRTRDRYLGLILGGARVQQTNSSGTQQPSTRTPRRVWARLTEARFRQRTLPELWRRLEDHRRYRRAARDCQNSRPSQACLPAPHRAHWRSAPTYSKWLDR